MHLNAYVYKHTQEHAQTHTEKVEIHGNIHDRATMNIINFNIQEVFRVDFMPLNTL